MIAAVYRKQSAVIGKGPLLHILHMCPINPQGHIVLGFASHRAGVTTDTVPIVNDESVVHRVCVPIFMEILKCTKASPLIIIYASAVCSLTGSGKSMASKTKSIISRTTMLSSFPDVFTASEYIVISLGQATVK